MTECTGSVTRGATNFRRYGHLAPQL